MRASQRITKPNRKYYSPAEKEVDAVVNDKIADIASKRSEEYLNSIEMAADMHYEKERELQRRSKQVKKIAGHDMASDADDAREVAFERRHNEERASTPYPNNATPHLPRIVAKKPPRKLYTRPARPFVIESEGSDDEGDQRRERDAKRRRGEKRKASETVDLDDSYVEPSQLTPFKKKKPDRKDTSEEEEEEEDDDSSTEEEVIKQSTQEKKQRDEYVLRISRDYSVLTHKQPYTGAEGQDLSFACVAIRRNDSNFSKAKPGQRKFNGPLQFSFPERLVGDFSYACKKMTQPVIKKGLLSADKVEQCRRDSAGHIRLDEYYDAYPKKRFRIENMTVQRTQESFTPPNAKNNTVTYEAISFKRFDKSADMSKDDPIFSLGIPIDQFPKLSVALEYIARQIGKM